MKSEEKDFAISFEGIADHSLAVFLRNNWGLAIHIRNKLKIKCGVSDLLWFAIEAYDRAQKTYDKKRNSQKIDTVSKYDFNHHWAQELKSLLIGEKKRDMAEVSYEELLETNPAVLSREIVPINREIPYEDKLKEILKLVKSKKIAEHIAIMSRHGYKEEYIATEVNLPFETVETVISLMEEIRDAA